jgi:hypothetical protein
VTDRTRVWTVVQLIVAAIFLATVWQFHEPGAGFTALIEFPGTSHEYELPAIRDVPHYHHRDSGGYDGQYYAQLAVDPLLRDGAIDRAMDNPPYRARRILFSWTAYAIGGGDPARVLRVYALQNVSAWLIFGWLLCRWMPPVSGRHTALWAGCMLSHGMLSSVRYALPDAPSALLVTAGVAAAGVVTQLDAADRKSLATFRSIGAALVVGLAGLARETSLLAAAMFLALVRTPPRRWLLAALCLFLCAVPLLLWLDYLRSIYRSFSIAGADHLTVPLSGLFWKLQRLRSEIAGGVSVRTLATAAAVAGFLVQAGVIFSAVIRFLRSTAPERSSRTGRSDWAHWALVGAAFVTLAMFTHRDVFAGAPGAFTRVFLPVTLAANAILAASARPRWILIATANLGAVAGIMELWSAWG